jgi:hypothetical protein
MDANLGRAPVTRHSGLLVGEGWTVSRCQSLSVGEEAMRFLSFSNNSGVKAKRQTTLFYPPASEMSHHQNTTLKRCFVPRECQGMTGTLKEGAGMSLQTGNFDSIMNLPQNVGAASDDGML